MFIGGKTLTTTNYDISLVQTDDKLKISIFTSKMKITKLYVSAVYSEDMVQTLSPIHENEFCIDLKQLITDLNQKNIKSNKLNIQVFDEFVPDDMSAGEEDNDEGILSLIHI